jgi:hypothetical protein
MAKKEIEPDLPFLKMPILLNKGACFFRNLHFFNFVLILLQFCSLDATFISVGDVKNVYGFKKSAV